MAVLLDELLNSVEDEFFDEVIVAVSDIVRPIKNETCL